MTPCGQIVALLGIGRQFNDDLRPRLDMPRGGIGREDLFGEDVAVRQHEPFAVLFDKCSDEPFL